MINWGQNDSQSVTWAIVKKARDSPLSGNTLVRLAC